MVLYESSLYQAPQYDLPTNGSELDFDQLGWNSGRHWHLNCYNYCLNDYVHNFMHPGQWGHYYNDQGSYLDYISNGKYLPEYFTKEVLEEMAYWDSQYIECESSNNQTITGFSFGEVSEYEVCPIGTYKVDLNPNNLDFHWYRQNKDGTWSHKPGVEMVENWDYNGNPIYNPKYCDRREPTGHNCFYYVSPYLSNSVL